MATEPPSSDKEKGSFVDVNSWNNKANDNTLKQSNKLYIQLHNKSYTKTMYNIIHWNNNMTNYTLKWQRILQWHNKITDYTLEQQQHNKLYTETPQQNYALKQQHKLCSIIAEEEKEEKKKQKQRRRR